MSFDILSIYSLNGYFNNVPILKLKFLEPSLCITIIFLFDNFIIGESDEPLSVLHLYIKLNTLLIPFDIPYDTAAFCWLIHFRYCIIYIHWLYKLIFSSNISLSISRKFIFLLSSSILFISIIVLSYSKTCIKIY